MVGHHNPAVIWKLLGLVNEIANIVCKNDSALGCGPEQLKIIIGVLREIFLRCSGNIMSLVEERFKKGFPGRVRVKV